jgi:hypothetical protein
LRERTLEARALGVERRHDNRVGSDREQHDREQECEVDEDLPS